MLNTTTCASAINVAMDSYIASYPSGNFSSAFVSAYKAYSQAGVLSAGGGVAGTENDSILTSFFNSFSSSTTDSAFGQALADYWATCMLTPSAGSVSVVNNASSKAGAFTAAISASYTTSSSTPYYKVLLDNIQSVVSTIQWTCTKVSPIPPTVETIS